MIAGYLVRRNVKPFEYGQEFEAKPEDLLSLFAKINLKITVKSPYELECIKTCPGFNDEELIFCQDNLRSYQEKGEYIFQTRYSKSLENIRDLDSMIFISESTKAKYLNKPYKKLEKIVKDIVGNETECIEIMKKFHDFVRKHVREKTTSSRSLKSIVKELKKKGVYHGSCKEVATLYSGLCDCVGLPSRKIVGKHTEEEGGHVWNEVMLPYDYKRIWVPDDAALDHFNEFDQHIIHAYLPEAKNISPKRLLAAMIGKNQIKIKVEQV
ncbi:MAG: transglutaminase-like domain-containing protein [Nanoarchaeota archaeon]|nr:transglutaminase-like domain-containing protein [Nanoarchaeota archaeon]MCG2717629.1 transglutaminase-like domain-containing protein [Nanoarchaeota archaeon]